MTWAHDTTTVLSAAIAYVNAACERDRRSVIDGWPIVCSPPRDENEPDDPQRLRRLQSELRELLTADGAQAAELVNRTFARARATLRLERHDDTDWHLHPVVVDAPLQQVILVDTAMAMAELVRRNELARLGVCASERCERLWLDLSRNRARRYCSDACANRHAVAEYRSRQRLSA